MFGQFVKLFQNIPPSSSTILPEWLLSTIDEAYFKMTSSDKGPVHLNVMVEEPFFQKEQSYSTYLNHISGWLSSNTPIKAILPTKTTLLNPAKQQLTLKNVIAVVGHIENSQDADLIATFCKDKQIPVLTECHSKLFGYTNTIHCVDLFLSNFNNQLVEDYTVLFFGHQLVSKTCIHFRGRPARSFAPGGPGSAGRRRSACRSRCSCRRSAARGRGPRRSARR